MTGTVEFSRPVSLAKLGEGEQIETITATEVERAALVRRFGLLGRGCGCARGGGG